MTVKIYVVVAEQLSSGTNYKVKNSISNKVLCSAWKNEADALMICEALNLYNDCIRSGIYDKVMKKLIAIREYNERHTPPNP